MIGRWICPRDIDVIVTVVTRQKYVLLRGFASKDVGFLVSSDTPDRRKIYPGRSSMSFLSVFPSLNDSLWTSLAWIFMALWIFTILQATCTLERRYNVCTYIRTYTRIGRKMEILGRFAKMRRINAAARGILRCNQRNANHARHAFAKRVRFRVCGTNYSSKRFTHKATKRDIRAVLFHKTDQRRSFCTL